MENALQVIGLSKVYKSGFQALKQVDLEIKKGEIFALLGPNGAGKTTLISIICGIVNASSGKVSVDGVDLFSSPRLARKKIGLVPQELALSMFETVWDTVTFTRGLYGKPNDSAHLKSLLQSLSLWDKKDEKVMSLSGGMKRRVLIAKALSHEPDIVFLDEPTAGVDVELRQEMWAIIRKLRGRGATIILTTHYIEEAEDLADRIGVINQGELVLVDEKENLMSRLGKKNLQVKLKQPLNILPSDLEKYGVSLSEDLKMLSYAYASHEPENNIHSILKSLSDSSAEIYDVQTQESSLEDIFVSIVESEA